VIGSVLYRKTKLNNLSEDWGPPQTSPVARVADHALLVVEIYPHPQVRTLPTPDSDFTDATRAYPTDFTDESNRLNQIAFE
jgi:hypothetical protein